MSTLGVHYLNRGVAAPPTITNQLPTMSSTPEPLVLQSIQLYPKNVYSPKHTVAVYFDTDTRTYIARATIGTEVIVEVEGTNNIDALMKMSSRIHPIFRAMRSAA